MRFIIFLFALIGYFLAVSALPSPLRSHSEHQGNNSSISSTTHDVFVRHDDPLFARYFDGVYDISEREFLEATIEPRGGVATIAKAVVKGVIKIVELIKGKIAADKKVTLIFLDNPFVHVVDEFFWYSEKKQMDVGYGCPVQEQVSSL